MAARALLPRLQDFEVHHIIHHPTDCLLLTLVWFPIYHYFYTFLIFFWFISFDNHLGPCLFLFPFFSFLFPFVVCQFDDVRLFDFFIISDTVLRMPSLKSKELITRLYNTYINIHTYIIYPSFGCSVDLTFQFLALHSIWPRWQSGKNKRRLLYYSHNFSYFPKSIGFTWHRRNFHIPHLKKKVIFNLLPIIPKKLTK